MRTCGPQTNAETVMILNGSDGSDKRYNMNCEVAFYIWRPIGGLSKPLKHSLPIGLVMDWYSYRNTSRDGVIGRRVYKAPGRAALAQPLGRSYKVQLTVN